MDVCFNLVTHQAPTKANYKKEKVMRLEELIKIENVKLGYKLEHSQLPITIEKMMKSDSKKKSLEKTHPYPTRTKNLPNLPTALNKAYHTSFLVQSIKEYERLPTEIRESITLNSFIKQVKKKVIVN